LSTQKGQYFSSFYGRRVGTAVAKQGRINWPDEKKVKEKEGKSTYAVCNDTGL